MSASLPDRARAALEAARAALNDIEQGLMAQGHAEAATARLNAAVADLNDAAGVRACPCPCNPRPGFCGGCGHAGCGRRRGVVVVRAR